MIAAKLRPCRCGATDRLLTMQKTLRDGYEEYKDDPDAYAYHIRCGSCAATGPWYKTVGNAVRGWNMRPCALQGKHT